jgi:hypothetical protein
MFGIIPNYLEYQQHELTVHTGKIPGNSEVDRNKKGQEHPYKICPFTSLLKKLEQG